jgi:hypothetical protein
LGSSFVFPHFPPSQSYFQIILEKTHRDLVDHLELFVLYWVQEWGRGAVLASIGGFADFSIMV